MKVGYEMKTIGVTGKSGTGKSYIARKICENFKNSQIITMDKIFSQLINQSKVIHQLENEFPEKNLVENGKINLDLILSDKTFFSRIYSLIQSDLEKQVLSQMNEYRDKNIDTLVIEWWGLPKTDLMNLCDCSVYVDSAKRLEALEKREKYINQKDIDARDDVLAVDYEKCDYDVTVENDMTEETIDKAIQKIQKEIETPTMQPEMHLEEFRKVVEKIGNKYNAILSQRQKQNPLEIKAYMMLTELTKTKSAIELGGNFKKSLGSIMTEQDKANYITKINTIIKDAQSEFPEDEITQDDVEQVLQEKSAPTAELIKACSTEIKQASLDTNHSISSAIYCSPDELEDGKLKRSKDVINIKGEIGEYTFAQTGTLVCNGYLLRKSGVGVEQGGGICIPGEANFVHAENGRAILNEPVYVYLMKTNQFEPVVSIADKEGIPQIDFSGEWTSDRDVERMDMRVKQYTDVTEMLEYMQIFSLKDRETYRLFFIIFVEEWKKQILDLLKQGKIHYINGECGKNTIKEIVDIKQQPKNEKYTITKNDIIPIAKDSKVTSEIEDALEDMEGLEKTPEIEQKNSQNLE